MITTFLDISTIDSIKKKKNIPEGEKKQKGFGRKLTLGGRNKVCTGIPGFFLFSLLPFILSSSPSLFLSFSDSNNQKSGAWGSLNSKNKKQNKANIFLEREIWTPKLQRKERNKQGDGKINSNQVICSSQVCLNDPYT